MVFILTFLFLLNMLHQDPNIKEKKLKLTDGSRMRYSLSIPARSSHAAHPLILALHWGWEMDKPVPEYYGKTFLQEMILPAFNTINPIIIAPDCPSTTWYNQRSEQAILALIQKIQTDHNIDSNMIIITGFSAGGMGTWYMASRHPDMFTLAIPMASIPKKEWTEDWSDLPLYIINATNDEVFPFEYIEPVLETLKENKVTHKLMKVTGASHYESRKFIAPLRYSVNWYSDLGN